MVSWLYAIGALFSVLRDPMFQRIAQESSVERAVRRLRTPFYLVCGYDDAGSRVVRELAEDGTAAVVIDQESTRVDAVEVDELQSAVPALLGDASDPKTLALAGLTQPCCAGVLALTGRDDINTMIALTARLLAPGLPVLCSARANESHARMAAAGATQIINPFDTFAERVALAIRTPSLHVIYESLTTQGGTAMNEPLQLPHTRWLLCGFGLFARTLRHQLERLQIETLVVDTELDESCDESNSVAGDPTDPAVLRRAGIEDAGVLVAGTAVDIDNLAIALAGRALNKQLFIIARQTQRRHDAMFRAAPIDLSVLGGYIVAAEVLRVIRAPQLTTFLRRARDEDEAWAADLLERMREASGKAIVESWSIELTVQRAPAIARALDGGETVTLRRLMTSTDDQGQRFPAVPLLLQRGHERVLTPSDELPLQSGDRVLCCGSAQARALMRRNLRARALPRGEAPAPVAGLQQHAA